MVHGQTACPRCSAPFNAKELHTPTGCWLWAGSNLHLQRLDADGIPFSYGHYLGPIAQSAK